MPRDHDYINNIPFFFKYRNTISFVFIVFGFSFFMLPVLLPKLRELMATNAPTVYSLWDSATSFSGVTKIFIIVFFVAYAIENVVSNKLLPVTRKREGKLHGGLLIGDINIKQMNVKQKIGYFSHFYFGEFIYFSTFVVFFIGISGAIRGVR